MFLRKLLPWRRKQAATKRFGEYEFVRIIHEGEKAKVYQARIPGKDEMYAIKVYNPAYNRNARHIRKRYNLPSEGEIGRMLNPRNGTASSDYPVIRTIGEGWEYGDASRCYYVVLEYVDGFNLKNLVTMKHALVRQRQGDIVRTGCRGLSLIHRAGYVHRDICTDNFLLPREGMPKLIDLGFAALIGQSFEEKSGTPSYMAPEQFLGQPLTPASDIYSFGIVLYEIFTGRLPYISTIPTDQPEMQLKRMSGLMQQHLRSEPPRPRDIVPELPDSIERIIMKCMKKSPEKRYTDTTQVTQDFSRAEEALRGPAAE